VVVLCLDLSKPSVLMGTAAAWLAAIRSKLAQTFQAFERRGLQLPQQLKQRARLQLGAGHEDADHIDVTGECTP
jgi:dynein light intermediate chain 2